MGLRDRLSGRARPTATYLLRIDDTTAAERELAEARADVQMVALAGADAQRVDVARERLRAAQAALEACFEPVVCTALPPDEFEALVDAHPARPDTDDEAWNVETFPRECFLACAPPDFSRDEWEEFLGTQVNDVERTRLYNTAINANVRDVDPSVPKDWTEILS